MKKLTLLTALIVGFAGSVAAQSEKVTFGVKAGLNIDHQLFTKNGITTLPDSKLGFHVGPMVDINLFANFFVQPQLLFTTKGSSTTQTGAGTTRNNLYYLELPVFLSYVFSIQNQLGIRAHAGPTVSLGLWGSQIDNNGNKSAMFTDSKFRRFDAGFCFGGGLEYRQVYFGFNYDVGLYNLAQKGSPYDYDHIKNRALMISMGYYF
jgi:hypothetical protein